MFYVIKMLFVCNEEDFLFMLVENNDSEYYEVEVFKL